MSVNYERLVSRLGVDPGGDLAGAHSRRESEGLRSHWEVGYRVPQCGDRLDDDSEDCEDRVSVDAKEEGCKYGAEVRHSERQTLLGEEVAQVRQRALQHTEGNDKQQGPQ
ncbi:hypothetical protein TRICI_002511 [Trichomonascus ciferrii]|uniref:Uncharacterized protein n=1 Tax=Trichomonascus ciferrii TaxID=44093 RepID=A0A642V6K0_9ASCO|nr:hypothetical protein TRICI_002511 [Trichomonascus ciferrii]